MALLSTRRHYWNVCVKLRAGALAAPYDAFTGKFAPLFRDHRALARPGMILFKADHDPVTGPAQLMRPQRVGKQCGEMPVPAFGMQDRQPCGPAGVEPSGRDQRQAPRLRPAPDPIPPGTTMW